MMESIKTWFQDWSDACEYAKECVPDMSFATPQEPYTALVSIAAACFLVWWWNERAIRKLQHATPALPAQEVRAIRSGSLAPTLGWARVVRSEPNKKAA
jgi:hypothetical protein